jgi:hypothetical protein
MTRSALLGLALLANLPAAAQTPPQQPPGIPATGADLRAISAACAPIPVAFRSTPDVARACMGYQAGVVTGFLVLAQMVGLPATFCIPPTASDLEIEQAIVQWIGDSAERNAAPAAASVIAALIDRYPCQAAPPTSPSPSDPQ